MQLAYLTDHRNESAETSMFNNLLEEKLHEALSLLCSKDMELIHAMFFKGLSFRELSKSSGIS